MKRPKFTPGEQKTIIKNYQNGDSMNRIAKEYNCSQCRIHNLLKRFNIQRRSTSEAKRIYELDTQAFDIIDTQGKAYFLGFFCADGHACKNKASLKIAIAEIDKDILSKLLAIVKSNYPIRTHKSRGNGKQNVCLIGINNIKIANRIKELGISSQKSIDLKFPDYIPNHLLKHYLRGYYDGNGCLVVSKRPNRIATEGNLTIMSTEHFIEGASRYCNDIGIKNFIYTSQPKGGMKKWNLRIGGNYQIVKFLDHLYENSDKDLFLVRKMNTFKRLLLICSKSENYSTSQNYIKERRLLEKY